MENIGEKKYMQNYWNHVDLARRGKNLKNSSNLISNKKICFGYHCLRVNKIFFWGLSKWNGNIYAHAYVLLFERL